MTSPRRQIQPDQIIFVGLSIILAALMIYFGLSSIPSAARPTLAPSADPSISASP